MKTKRILLLLFAVLTGCLFYSCDKILDKEKKKCRVVVMTEHMNPDRVTTFAYNNDDKISSMRATRGNVTMNKLFSYSGNTIIVNTSLTDGTNVSNTRDSVTLDSRGRISNTRQYFTNGGYFNNSYEYAGDILARVVQTNETAAQPVTSTITMDKGNVIRISNATITNIVEYYENEEVQQGDYFVMFATNIFGVPAYPQKNLIKTIDNGGGDIINFNYEKNADGYITRVTATRAATGTFLQSYQYECD